VHTSPTVLALPSLQVVPFEAEGFEHAPVAWSQVPATWHWSEAVQVTPMQWSTPAHAPAVHTSPTVLALASSQVVPFEAAGFEHVPVAWSHVPATWHWSLAVQVTPIQ
jgi:hypothetical protein